MRRRVVITGMGAITPLGHNVGDLFRSQVEGKSGVASITHFDARRFPTTFAAQVTGFDLAKHFPDPERWADSLHYLSLEGVYEAVGATRATHCDACFSGQYPLAGTQEANGKHALESGLPLVRA